MGAIQNAINQMTTGALGAAAGIKAAAVAKNTKEAVNAQKEESEFNLKMKQAELPVQQAETKLSQAEAEKNVKLGEAKKEFDTSYDNINKTKNNIIEKTDKGALYPDRYEQKAKEKIAKAAANLEEKRKVINFNYDQDKMKLSSELYQAQASAKKQQLDLISSRIEKIRGGSK